MPKPEQIDDREIEFMLRKGIRDGGYWQNFVNLINKYGIVPEYVFPDTYSSSNTKELNELLSKYLRKFTIEIRKNKNAVESTAMPTIENKDTNVEETPEKEENLPQKQEPTKEEYVGEEEKEAEQENVASQAQSKDEKAIELAKKEWGEDNSVTFNIEEKDGDKYYVAVKKDATSIKWYEVDTDKWTISEY